MKCVRVRVSYSRLTVTVFARISRLLSREISSLEKFRRRRRPLVVPVLVCLFLAK